MHPEKLKTKTKKIKRGGKKNQETTWPKICRAWIQQDPTAKTHPLPADDSWRPWSTCPKTSLQCHEEPQGCNEDLTASIPHPLHHTSDLATSPGRTHVGASEGVGESVCLCSLCIRQWECIKINLWGFFLQINTSSPVHTTSHWVFLH